MVENYAPLYPQPNPEHKLGQYPFEAEYITPRKCAKMFPAVRQVNICSSFSFMVSTNRPCVVFKSAHTIFASNGQGFFLVFKTETTYGTLFWSHTLINPRIRRNIKGKFRDPTVIGAPICIKSEIVAFLHSYCMYELKSERNFASVLPFNYKSPMTSAVYKQKIFSSNWWSWQTVGKLINKC